MLPKSCGLRVLNDVDEKTCFRYVSVFTERDGRNAQMYRDNQSKPGYGFGDGRSMNISY